MIFVTIGQMYGFNRLIIAADKMAGKIEEEIIMQIGDSSYTPINAKYFRYASAEKINDLYNKSRIVICHAGVGSILNALEFGKPVIVVPRRKELGEAFDDHQFEIADELSRSGKIKVVNDILALNYAISALKANPVRAEETENSLINHLRIYIQLLNG